MQVLNDSFCGVPPSDVIIAAYIKELRHQTFWCVLIFPLMDD